MSLTDTLIEATQEIFSSMVSLSASAGPSYERDAVPLEDSLTALIQLSGKYSGYTAINLAMPTALMVTSSFLFIDTEEITADTLQDALGELANIIAGSVKSYLDPGGSEIQLSLPMLISGSDFVAERLPNATLTTIPFYLDDGDFWVEVQLMEK